MFDKALVPLELRRSQKELSAMIKFLQSLKVDSVHLLHVMSEGIGQKNRLKNYIDEVAHTLSAETEMELTTEVRDGHVASEISQAANDSDADFIYITSNHRGFMYRTFLGSTSRDVIRLTEKPAFVHKSRPYLLAQDPISRILYATDFGPTAQKAIDYVEYLGELVEEIYLLHVGKRAPDPFEEKRRQQEVNTKLEGLAKELEADYKSVEFISEIGSPHKVIQSYSERKEVDLIIMGRLSRPGGPNIMGSTSERVSGSASSSILLIP
ncbi:MAG: universal stress protein [Archaeoglobaceae archaeon]